MSFIFAVFARVFLHINLATQWSSGYRHQAAGNMSDGLNGCQELLMPSNKAQITTLAKLGQILCQLPLVLALFLLFGLPLTFAAGSFSAIVDNGASASYGFGSIGSASSAEWNGNQAAFPANERIRYEYYGPMYWEAWGGPQSSPPNAGWTDYWMGFLEIDLKTGAITGPRPLYCVGYIPDKPPPKDLGPDCDPGSLSTPNPIRIGTGNKFMVETDFNVSSGLLPFKRYYNSSIRMPSGQMGRRWRHSYERAIEPVFLPNKTPHISFASVVRESGKTFTYELKNSVWIGDADVPERLASTTDTTGNVTGWQLTTRSDEVEYYDAQGKLQSILARGGKTTTLAYDTSGRLQTVTDPYGRRLVFTYDPQNRLSTMTDPAGGIYTYAYDANHNLASVTYPDGKARAYLYENPSFKHALTGILDENASRYATYTYDAQGRAISSEHAGGADKYTLGYNADGSTLVTDPLGTARRYGFTTILGVVKNTSIGAPCNSCGGAGAATGYDANGNIASKTDFNGNVTTYTHDLARNLETSRTEAAGKPQARTVTTAWHPTYRLPTQISEPGRSTHFSYDASGNLLQKIISSGSQTRVWSYSYNQWGQVTSADGPRSDVSDLTSYTYDAQGNLASITNALGHLTRITAHDPHGRPLAMTDPNGVQTSLAYDPRGRLLQKTSGGETTFYSYDAVGQLVRLALPDGSSLAYSYDPAHRLTGIADGQGNRIAYTLDAMGNRLKEDVIDPAGQLARTRTQAYDGLGRLSRVLDSQSHATSYSYDPNGNLLSITDANGATTSHSYDPLGRLIQTLDPLGGATRTQYDSLNQVIAVTDPINVTTTYQLDGLGNVGGESSPDSGSTANTYDSAGNLLTRTDATGTTLSYAYDALNRLTRIDNGSGPLVSYAWDGGSIGQLAQIQDPSGATAYQYDPLGRVNRKTQTQGSLSQSVSYAYAPGGLLTQLTTPGGNLVGYAYAGGKPVSIALNGQPLLNNITHEPHGPVSGWTWGNGLPHLRAHGLDGELQRIESAVAQTYGYDSAGRLNQLHLWSQVSPPQNDTLNQYSLDAVGRLTGSSSTLTPAAPGAPITDSLAYGYDANGNRQSLAWNAIPTDYSYSANRLTRSTGADNKTYAYDGAGRMVGDGRYTYVYDAMGRLSTVTDGGGAVLASYRYNALGQRVAKDGNGTVSVPGSLTLLYDSFSGTENRPIDDQDDKLWKGGGKKNTVAQVQNGQAVIAEGKQIQSKTEFTEGEGLTLTATLYRGRVGLTSTSGNLMVKYDGNKTITVNSDDSEDTEDPAKAKFKATQAGQALKVEITVKLGKGRARIISGSETFDSGEVAVAQNQNWRIRLAAVKVKKTAMTGIVDDVSLKQATQGQTTQSGRRFVYDEAGHLVGEYGPTGKMVQEVVWLNDLPVASVRPKAAGGTEVLYIHPDHLGAPRQVTDQTNRIVWRWDTVDAFGVELPNEDADRDGVRFEFNIRFPGQYYDKETGRHYNYFRDYDPGTGRYIGSDPIGLESKSLNRFSYADGNPVTRSDPSGLSSTDDTPVMIYGAWCGPNWTGGSFGSFDPNKNGSYRRPLDELDGCCREHDICYFKCRKTTSCGTDEQSACFRSCDRTLASCAGKSNGPSIFKAVVGGYMQTSNPKAEQCQCKQ